jgi:PAS domain S-box-containing protein
MASPKRLAENAGFRTLFEAAPDAMVLTDTRGRIVLVNAQAERLFGYSRDEMVGREIEVLIPQRYRHAHVGDRTAYSRDVSPRPMGARLDLYALRKDGTEFPADISLSPISWSGEPFIVSAIRDITDRRAGDAERARLLEERAAHDVADRVKDEFLATLSHELRTPLNAILGWVALARTRPLDPEVDRALTTIDRNARMQVQLIEDLLDVSRVLAGKLRLDIAAVDFTEVCDAAVDVIRPAAQGKGLHLDVTYESRPLLMMGDADRLQQVVWNLLANAVKFTPRGGRIELQVRRSDESAIRLLVRDTGRGIPPEFLPYVFERFRQQDSTVTRRYAGLGIGLSIARSLVESHGGTIEAASSGEDRGATFVVSLPGRAAATRDVPRAREDSRAAAADLHGCRVLIVDDQLDERELLSEVMSHAGAIVETATSAADALARLAAFTPDVLLSDIAMPGQDGHSLMRRIRGMDSPIGRIPAIAVTAHARAEDRDRAFAAGFQDYVAKPIDISRLVERVARLVRTHARD